MKWKYLLGLLVSAAFLYLAFRKVNLPELRSALKSARYVYVAPVAALMLLSLWLRALRWHYLLAPIKRIGMGSLFSATAIGLMANDVLPARIGEIVRAHFIGDREMISRSASLATIVVERLFDGITILFFLAAIMLFGAKLPGWLGTASIAAVIFYCLALAVLVLFLVRTTFVLRLGERIARPLPRSVRERLLAVLYSFANGLAVFRSRRSMAVAVVLSPLVWLPSTGMIHLLLISFNIHLPIATSFLLLIALCIGVMVPSAPGYVGTIQFVCVTVLGLFGVSAGPALSFSLLYHACIYIPVVAVGLLCLVSGGISLRDINMAARKRE